MLNERKEFIVQLLKKYQADVPVKSQLFAEFLNDDLVVQAFNQVWLNQNIMLDHWKLKLVLDDIRQAGLQMPNATAGKEYSFVIDLSQKPFDQIIGFELVDFETTGLTYDVTTRTISGVPEAAGEYKLVFKFQVAGSEEWQQKHIRFVVNPNPKSLWKDLPSNEADPYWKPDASQEFSAFGPNWVVAASKRGRSHAHEGKFRDDHFAFIFLEAIGWGIVAVSDGAGSAKSSRKGSEIACQAVLDYFSKTLTVEDWNGLTEAVTTFNQEKSETNSKALSQVLIGNLSKAAYAAHKAIAEFALKSETPARDFAATLLFSLVKKFDSGYCIASFGVGDGGIGSFEKEAQAASLLTLPDGGEYAGQTRFITMPDIFKDEQYFKRFSIKILPTFTALIFMTDGITDPKFQTDANLNKPEKWQELWLDLNGQNDDSLAVAFDKKDDSTAESLLKWLDFWSPGNHDDRTIVVLFPGEAIKE